jgi:putative FmdB family regulatory protein
MPLYEYECKKCHHRFERIQKFSDPHVTKCPKCKGPIEQLISAPAVQFKGSGWYVTDYAKGGSQPGASNGESSGKDAKAKSEKAADDKSDSKKSGSSKSESPKADSPKTETTKSESPAKRKSEKK